MIDRTNRLLHWARTIRRLMTSDGLRVHVSYDALIDEIRVEVMKEANRMEENKNDTAEVEQEKARAAKPDPPSASLGDPIYHVNRLLSALKDLSKCVMDTMPKVVDGDGKTKLIQAMGEAYAAMPGAETFLHSPTIPGGPQWWDRLETVAASLGALPNDDQLAAIERGVKRLQQLQSNWTRRPGDSRMLAALKSLVDVVRRGSVVNETGYSWKVLAKDLDAAMLEAGTAIAFAEEDNFHDHKKYESVPGFEHKPIDAEFPEVEPAPPSWWVIEMLGPAYITVTNHAQFQWTEQIEQAVQFTNEADANNVREALAKLEPDLFPVRLPRPATAAEYFWSAPGVARR